MYPLSKKDFAVRYPPLYESKVTVLNTGFGIGAIDIMGLLNVFCFNLINFNKPVLKTGVNFLNFDESAA